MEFHCHYPQNQVQTVVIFNLYINFYFNEYIKTILINYLK